MFWDNRMFELVDLEEGEFSILCWFKNCGWVGVGVH